MNDKTLIYGITIIIKISVRKITALISLLPCHVFFHEIASLPRIALIVHLRISRIPYIYKSRSAYGVKIFQEGTQ